VKLKMLQELHGYIVRVHGRRRAYCNVCNDVTFGTLLTLATNT
jgi:hypothetical protein